MTAWTIKPNADKTYANAVTFFNEKVANLEVYEASSGNANTFKSANTSVEIADMLNAHKATNEELPLHSTNVTRSMHWQ